MNLQKRIVLFLRYVDNVRMKTFVFSAQERKVCVIKEKNKNGVNIRERYIRSSNDMLHSIHSSISSVIERESLDLTLSAITCIISE